MAEAQLVDVPHLRMSQPVTAYGAMGNMIAVFDSLAWKLTRELDPSFSVAEETFVAAGESLRLDAFEQYIRGITEPDQAERLRHLEQAVKLSPDFSPAWMALGREDYTGAAIRRGSAAFAKVDPQRARTRWKPASIAGCRCCFQATMPRPKQAFAAVARVLPLAEVLNNQAVAISRQGHDGSALFVAGRGCRPERGRLSLQPRRQL